MWNKVKNFQHTVNQCVRYAAVRHRSMRASKVDGECVYHIIALIGRIIYSYHAHRHATIPPYVIYADGDWAENWKGMQFWSGLHRPANGSGRPLREVAPFLESSCGSMRTWPRKETKRERQEHVDPRCPQGRTSSQVHRPHARIELVRRLYHSPSDPAFSLATRSSSPPPPTALLPRLALVLVLPSLWPPDRVRCRRRQRCSCASLSSRPGLFYGGPYHPIPLLEKDQYERIWRLRLIVYHHDLNCGMGWYV
jgi:hypothetical protein